MTSPLTVRTISNGKTLTQAYGSHQVSDSLNESVDLFSRLLRQVLGEYNPEVLADFDTLLELMVRAQLENTDVASNVLTERTAAFTDAKDFIDKISLDRAQELTRALSCFFHLANLSEENYRTSQIDRKEHNDFERGGGNAIGKAFVQLSTEVGQSEALKRLNELEFHPVLTAHPTEARRKAISGKIRRLTELLEEHKTLGGISLVENERKMLNEIDAMFRTSPIALNKPTPLDESDTVTSILDESLFDCFITAYRRLDDFLQQEVAQGETGYAKPLAPAFIRLGSWIGSDRDGNPNVVSSITRQVAQKFSTHITSKLASEAERIGRNLTLETTLTPPSKKLLELLQKLISLFSEDKDLKLDQAFSLKEPHRATVVLIARRLAQTAARNSDYEYDDVDELLADLRTVQESLQEAGAARSAFGPLQNLIWQVETFGVHLAEMEVRQHSQVHKMALDEIEAEGGVITPSLSEKTMEVVETFRAIGAIQRRYGEKACSRYIISFTQSPEHITDVYRLAAISEGNNEKYVAKIDVIPLFETMEDLENSVDILNGMLQNPAVQKRLEENGRRQEVMLGYSDSSKDVGPVAATFALHSAQERIANWARENNIKLTLFHGRGGALGRGGGPAHRAVLAQPRGSVDGCFKVTEQGETIAARYGNPQIAIRHIEAVAAATLLNSTPSVENRNEIETGRFKELTAKLTEYSREAFHNLVQQEGFPNWFAEVTPLEEVGMLPIGSRPAKRGLSINSLEDLRAIPWVFSWSQARINLAAWFGFGSACAKIAKTENGLDTLRAAYRDWNLFKTMVDNMEMSIAKTDVLIAKEYLSLGERDDLSQKVIDELLLTREMALKITGNTYPLQNRKVLGQAVQVRGPYIDALSLMQVAALKKIRKQDFKSADPEQERKGTQFLILCTVNGVAAGLQNTG